jgi:hypothetical protein
MKGRTRWFKRCEHPTIIGEYECTVRLPGGVVVKYWNLPWDGTGFLVRIPMVVLRWRGLTKKAHDAMINFEGQG